MEEKTCKNCGYAESYCYPKGFANGRGCAQWKAKDEDKCKNCTHAVLEGIGESGKYTITNCEISHKRIDPNHASCHDFKRRDSIKIENKDVRKLPDGGVEIKCKLADGERPDWFKNMLSDKEKIGTVANSCSTMHKIADKEFELDDFSYEHLISIEEAERLEAEDEDYMEDCCVLPQAFTKIPIEDSIMDSPLTYPLDVLEGTITMLNACRDLYLKTNDKRYWWQMIQLLPSSYNQKRTVMLNYEVLSHIYSDRKDHKLDDWHDFCAWIEKLPFAEGIIFPMFGETIEKVPDDIVNARFKDDRFFSPSRHCGKRAEAGCLDDAPNWCRLEEDNE